MTRFYDRNNTKRMTRDETAPVLVTVKGSEGGVELRATNGHTVVVWLTSLDALTLADDISRLAEQKIERELR